MLYVAGMVAVLAFSCCISRVWRAANRHVGQQPTLTQKDMWALCACKTTISFSLCSNTQESEVGEAPTQQLQQKPALVFNKVLQQLRQQQQQSRADVLAMPAPVQSLVSVTLLFNRRQLHYTVRRS